MPKTYSAVELGAYIAQRAIDQDHSISVFGLCKVLYLMQKKWIQKFRRILFHDTIEARKHGPIIPTVKREFCAYGAGDIFILFGKHKTMSGSIEFADDDKEWIDFYADELLALSIWKLHDLSKDEYYQYVRERHGVSDFLAPEMDLFKLISMEVIDGLR